MASHPDRGSRPTNNAGFQVTQFRRPPVVFSLSRDRSACNSALEAAWSCTILQPASLGTTGCLCIAVSGSRQSRSSRTIKNQFAAVFDWPVQSRRLEFSAEAEVDALEDVQSP